MAVILEDKQGLLSGLKYSKTFSDGDNKGEDDCDVCKHVDDDDSEQHGANSEEAEFNDEESDDDVESKDEVEH